MTSDELRVASGGSGVPGDEGEQLSPREKAWRTVARRGWDETMRAKAAGHEEPENPYWQMSFARNAWKWGRQAAREGRPRP